MKARLNGTKDPFVEITEVSLANKPYVVYSADRIEFEQEKTQQESTSDHWQEQDNTMAFTLMRDIEQVSFISKEGKDERISWLNSLEDRFSNQESNKGHWQDVRERAAIAAMQGTITILSNSDRIAFSEIVVEGYRGKEKTYPKEIAEFAVACADALVEKLKGE